MSLFETGESDVSYGIDLDDMANRSMLGILDKCVTAEERLGFACHCGGLFRQIPYLLREVSPNVQFTAAAERNGRSMLQLEGTTPLHGAAVFGLLRTGEALIKCGADVNLANAGDGEFPLWRAAASGHTNFVRLLLHYGARVDQERRKTERVDRRVRRQMEAGAISREAGLRELADDRDTALEVAVRKGRPLTTKALIEAGADLERYGHRALIRARQTIGDLCLPGAGAAVPAATQGNAGPAAATSPMNDEDLAEFGTLISHDWRDETVTVVSETAEEPPARAEVQRIEDAIAVLIEHGVEGEDR